jgi:hypothetical protein
MQSVPLASSLLRLPRPGPAAAAVSAPARIYFLRTLLPPASLRARPFLEQSISASVCSRPLPFLSNDPSPAVCSPENCGRSSSSSSSTVRYRSDTLYCVFSGSWNHRCPKVVVCESGTLTACTCVWDRMRCVALRQQEVVAVQVGPAFQPQQVGGMPSSSCPFKSVPCIVVELA